jgi:putative glutathione S-transferase
MGRLVDGKWLTKAPAPTSASGAFERAESQYRNWITPDGAPGPSGSGGFPAASGRYHLYVSLACPWAHRTLIFRQLKGLVPHVSVSIAHPVMLEHGWPLNDGYRRATGDTLFGAGHLYEIYLRADPRAITRATIPVLWDRETGTIVSNESAEIIRMFNAAFDAITGNTLDFWPEDLRAEIATVNARVYATLNNGVYRAGFARTQAAYDEAVAEVFDTLDWLETRLGEARYLMGARLTEADWRLFTTLVRFDAVYHQHFKCARNRLVDFPNLWAFARELYQMPGIAGTVDFDHIRQHYYRSNESINPRRIVPVAPRVDWTEPHRRGAA